MKISREKLNNCNSFLLGLILSTIFFPVVSTILLGIFVLLNLYNYNYLKFDKKKACLILLTMTPFLIEIVFVWTSLDAHDVFKHIEKKLSYLIIPLFVIPNYKSYSLLKIANNYRYLLTVILVVLVARFCIVYPEFVSKYFNGIHLWEMGYIFTNSFNNHAPAVNLHVAFLVLLNLYFLLKTFNVNTIINALLLVVSLLVLLIINTRVSLVSVLFGSIVIGIYLAYTTFASKVWYFLGGFSVFSGLFLLIAFNSNPYMKEKYTKVTFSNLEMIGRLDEVENPNDVLHNALVTRLTIWDTTIKLSKEKCFFGYGSAHGKPKLFEYYQVTNQQFLSKYNFPVHNQFLDYLLKFGVIGLLIISGYFGWIFYLAAYSKNVLGCVFIINFILSNLFDDFLIRFDGIAYSAIGFTLIVVYYLRYKSRLI